MSNPKWQDNAIQFPRLLAEIMATQALDMAALAESMDLSVEEVSELFDRADEVWENSKAANHDKPPTMEPSTAAAATTQVFRGYFGYQGTQLDVEFQAAVDATDAEKDAAFVAALAQMADLNYVSVGHS